MVDLKLRSSSALLELEDAFRALLVAKRLGDERALAQPRHLPRVENSVQHFDSEDMQLPATLT